MTVPTTIVKIVDNKIDPIEPPPNGEENPVTRYTVNEAIIAKVASPPIVKAIMNPVKVRYLALGPTVKLG